MGVVPRYPDFKPLALDDREYISAMFSNYPPVTSELTFTNLFIWRDHYQFGWSMAGDALLIAGATPPGKPFALPPVGDDDLAPAFRLLLEHLGKLAEVPEIHRVPEPLVRRYAASLALEAEDSRAQSDYVYRTESLITLSGRKYHGKRNHINQFRSAYAYRYEPLTPRLIEACLELQEEWCRLRECTDNPALLSEERAVHEALRQYFQLGLTGAAIVVNARVVAFSLGEPLNPETAVIHVEKANPQFPGSYAVMNQEFCRHAWSKFTYLNREQDLGDQGLRQAKLSYYPDHLISKFTLRAVRS
ncbi:MAG TPA: phosphatidylglycerol lysyltransferase domain-containing protein [Syntrophobacteria bacterium]|nr:phosphatidylglycerol lysyltransferase domain-containing protein [Syntrophobacteria bacterium]